MLSRRTLITLTGSVLTLAALAASPALAEEKFTPEALAAAQKAGKPILVEVAAPWCPTCKAQEPILNKLTTSDKFKSFVRLKVDFDSQKPDLKLLNARTQSTLIVYKGETEVGRSVGDTNEASVEALLAKAI